MNRPSVSIAFPCWNRGNLLAPTLLSIRRQNYPVELIVVESGDDGVTEELAGHFSATYIREPRDEYPVFQNIAKLWNRCWQAATTEFVILQCAEVLHESPNVIADLVGHIENRSTVLATPLIKDLAADGSFAGWYNHPTAGSRPGWVSGAGPHAFRKSEMAKIGGYEELYYGYGGEDNFLFYLLGKNGWKIEYVESAVCAHQWHERTKYEPTTGYANRSLTNILVMETEEGKREPIANAAPIQIDTSVYESDISDVIEEIDCKNIQISKTYQEWSTEWLNSNRNADLTFVAQRIIANEGGRWAKLGEMVTEAAWAVLREREARREAARADREGMESWHKRAVRCADIDGTWAAHSLAKAKQLMASL